MAVKKENMAVVSELLRLNFDTAIPKNNGVTVLGIAALSRNLDLFTLLVDAGADPHYTSKQGIGALYLAVKGKATSIIDYLIRHKVPCYNQETEKRDNSPIFFAVKMNNLEALEAFIDVGPDEMNSYVNS